MAKAEISWKGRTPEGDKRQVYVQRVGGEWLFFERGRRYDQWQRLTDPPLEDWLELLDALRRRASRRLVRPEEPARIRQIILQRFPGASLGDEVP